MKVTDLRKINSRYKYGKGEKNEWFVLSSFNNGHNEDLIKWTKVNGGWNIWTDVQGKYQLGSVKINIVEVFTENQGKHLSGDG